MKNKINLLFVLVVPVLFSCKNDKGKIVEPSCNTPATVSFNSDIVPLFNTYCNTSGCHSGTNPAGNLDLTAASAYTALTNPSSGYIDTIHPTYSVLYAQMNSISNPMPPTGKLNKCKIELILTWIQQKAKNN